MPLRTVSGNCLNYREMTEKNNAVVYCNPVTWNDSDIKLSPVLINNEPYFVAVEVCKLLDLTNPTDRLKSLDNDEKLTYVMNRSGQNRTVNLVNESGFYHLIFISRKPQASAIRKWVTSDVLPTLRKTGRYELCQPSSPRRSVRRTRGEGVNVELTNLLWLIGESLMQGDQAAVALELGVSRVSVSRVLNGLNRSSRILMALYQKARQNREGNLLYYAPGVMAERLLGHEAALPLGNRLPPVQISGKRGGKIGNQNARKHWGKEGV